MRPYALEADSAHIFWLAVSPEIRIQVWYAIFQGRVGQLQFAGLERGAGRPWQQEEVLSSWGSPKVVASSRLHLFPAASLPIRWFEGFANASAHGGNLSAKVSPFRRRLSEDFNSHLTLEMFNGHYELQGWSLPTTMSGGWVVRLLAGSAGKQQHRLCNTTTSAAAWTPDSTRTLLNDRNPWLWAHTITSVLYSSFTRVLLFFCSSITLLRWRLHICHSGTTKYGRQVDKPFGPYNTSKSRILTT